MRAERHRHGVGGGGNTPRVYLGSGSRRVVSLTRFNGGVITWLADGTAYLSPDGRDLGGGGNTAQVHFGTDALVTMV